MLPQGAAPNAEPPGAASEAAIVQAAVEAFVEQHGVGEAPSPDAFVVRYPESVRPRLLAQIREFLAFDGLLGHQEWQPKPAGDPDGRAFGDFTIQEELGRGGMGIVYLAWQKSLNRRVALKVMASGLTLSKRHVERFRREAAAAAQVRHPSIVPVHSFTEVDGTFAFAMDFVAGRNLADLLDDLRLRNGEAPAAIEGTLGIEPQKGYVAECAILCAQLASALAAAHTAGVVHRDLKPRNVMVDDRRQARLLDFGLAKSLGEGSISMSGEITGTAHYMSPEQTLAKRVEVDHRADIWALGVILYELLTLRRPFDGKNLQQVVYEICFKEPVPIPKRNPKVPRDLVTICGKALEKDPQNRYATAAEFEADLLRFLRWEPIHAKPAGQLVRLAKWVHRHRTETLLAVAVLVLAIGAGGWRWYDARERRQRADGLLRDSELAVERGDYEAGIQQALEALRLHDDPAVLERVERYRASAETAATKRDRDIAESRRLSLASAQAIPTNRELALLLALGAVRVRPSAESRSAVLTALGSGFRTTQFELPQAQVFGARWSPDGRHVITVGTENDGGNVVLWSADGEHHTALRGHQKHVLDAAFHPDGTLVATAGVDHTVRLWRTADGGQAGVWQHDDSVTLVRFDRAGDRAITASYDRSGPFRARVWDVARGTPLATCSAHKRMVIAAALSPDGHFAASAGDPGFVRLWDAATGAELAQLPGQPERATALAFSPDGALLAIGDGTGAARIYAVPGGALLATVSHSQAIDALAFDTAGGRLLTGARDQTARLWRLSRTNDGGLATAELRTFVGHLGEISCVGFDARGELAVTTGSDGVVRVFDASDSTTAKGTELLRLEVGAPLADVAFDADGHRLLVQVGTQRALAWDFADTRGVVTLRQPGPVPAACFDPTGERVLTAGDDERVRLWHTRDGHLQWVTGKLGNPLLALDLDPAGERFAVATNDGDFAVHRCSDGERLYGLSARADATAAARPADVRCAVVRFAANGSRLLCAADRHAAVWNTNDQSCVRAFERPLPLVAADASPDGALLATVDRGEKVARLWSVADGAPRGELAATSLVRFVRFRADGRALLLGCADGTVLVVALDGTPIASFRTGGALVHASFRADGDCVLTSSARDQNRVRLWRLPDGVELLHFGDHANTVDWNTFGPDGQWALSSSRDGTTRIWPTDPVAAAARLQPRAPTPAEIAQYGLPTTEPPK